VSIVYLVTVSYYDVSGTAAGTLYYTNGTFNSSPTDTPADTHFAPRLKERPRLRRSTFSPGRTGGRATSAVGELVLINNDGGLDALNGYAFDARNIKVYRGEDTAAFPGGFTLMLTATASGPAVVTRTEVRIPLRDRQTELDVPLQTTVYAGNNSLPAGLEGVAGDLKDKPKPLCYGVVRNISPPLVNTSKLIYQVSDGAIDSVEAVRDSGVILGRDISTLTSNSNPFLTAGDSVVALAYSESLSRWCAVGQGTTYVCTSDNNGATWTARTSGFSNDVRCVTWSPDDALFVAGGGGGELRTSPDGITWTSRTANVGSNAINQVAYGGDAYVIVANGGGCASSTNGTTWVARSPGHGSEHINGAAYGPMETRGGVDTFVICGGAGKVSYSVNGGVSWTNVTSPGFGTDQVITVEWLNDHFLASIPGQTRISTDGSVWTEWSSIDSADIRDSAYASGLYVLVGTGSVIATSADGRSFVLMPPFSGVASYFAVEARDSVVMIGAAGGYILTTGPVNTTVSYASEAALLLDSNSPGPGAYGVYLAGGYVRLGSPPAGNITIDATQGDVPADRTGAQLSTDLLLKAGMTSGDWSAADVVALDSANSSILGLWTGTTETMVSRGLSFFADTLGAWWAFDKAGVWRTARLNTPLGATSVISFTENDVWGIERVKGSDARSGLPSYRQTVRYNRNYTVQNDLAGSVDDTTRALLAEEWQTVKAETASVKTAFLLAREVTTDTAYSIAANASTEATRRQVLRGTKRDVFDFTTRIDSNTLTLDLGQIINVTHSRFGLSSGKNLVVIGLDADAKTDSVRVQAWG
tara:strand:- start:1130 stop:3571 length:2442 start_codon:yes stop_codon:yes gene_type:complete